MNYGALITRAFRITTRHKFLWILGILAGGFGAGGGGGGPNPIHMTLLLESP